MSDNTLFTMKKGMSEKEYNSLLDNEELKVEYTFDDIGKELINVKVFYKGGSAIGSNYFVTFIDKKLYYWGYSYEYARHSDPLLNTVGKKALEKYKLTK